MALPETFAETAKVTGQQVNGKVSDLIPIFYGIILSTKKLKTFKGGICMKGYTTDCGYMGYLDGSYQLFADETDYKEAYYEENVD